MSRSRRSRGALDRPAAGPGALAHQARLAARGPAGAGAGQPDLAAPLRHRPGRHVRQPGLHRRAADAPRAARIPGRRARPLGLERQGAAPPDPDLRGLPAVERTSARGSSRSTPTTACWRGTRSAGSTPRRSATPCSPPRASSTTARAGPTSPTETDRRRRGRRRRIAAGAGLRRSVYLQQRRTQIASLLEVFDAPSIVTTCTRRLPSTIPLQSLSLLNSDFVVARARKLAERVGARVRARMCRRPDRPRLPADRRPRARRPEREAARRFLETQPARYPGSRRPRPSAAPGPTSARWSWRATPSCTSNDRRRP